MTNSKSQVDLTFTDNTLVLKGHLTMETVPLLQKQITKLSTQFKDPLTIDLAQTDHNDTAGLALLINLKAELIKVKVAIVIDNAPESLKKLSRLSDADKILALT